MIENFEKVCKTYREGIRMEKDADEVLDILLNSEKAMRPIDIARACGWFNNNISKKPLYGKAAAALQFL